jgi:hypothetical protein
VKCSEVSPLLSEYVDDQLDAATRGLVEEHVASCEDCTAKLRFLQAFLEAMAGMEKVSAPPDFLAAVHARIEGASAFNRFKKWLFCPLRIKLPMELAGIALATLLLVFAYQGPKQKEARSLPGMSGGVGQAVLPADEKGTTLDKAVANRPASAPMRITLALHLNPLPMPGHAAKLPSLSAAPSSGGKLDSDRRKAREPITGQPSPPMERVPPAPMTAAQKDESLSSLDAHHANELIREALANLGGAVVSGEARAEATEHQTILVRIPARNYPLFIERLRRAGHLEEPPEKPPQTMATTADNELLEIQIKLISPE